MKKLFFILFIAIICYSCTSRKSNFVQLGSKNNEQSEKVEPMDFRLKNSLTKKVLINYGEIIKDSIFDDREKILFIIETFYIKDTLVEFDGNSCYDIGLKISCYRETLLFFSKVFKKKDFYHLFEYPESINLNNLIITSFSIKEIKRNPCSLILSTYIGQPYTDYGFDFLIQLYINGNYTIQVTNDK